MIPCWGRVLWIAFATALIRWSSRASLIANGPLRDRRRRKPAGSRQPELWGTFRKCGYGHRNEIFFWLSTGNGAAPQKPDQAIASAQTAVKEQARCAALRSCRAPRP